MTILRMSDLDLAGKRVLIRQDLNVPISSGRIASDARLRASLPTLKLALEKGASVLVVSHLGRPKAGRFEPEHSLTLVAAWLSEALGRTVPLISNWIEGVQLAPGQIALGENTRFLVGEKADDEALAQRMAALCDVYVMDAFGTAHRAECSTHGVARFAPAACAGPLLAAELDALGKALATLERHAEAVVRRWISGLTNARLEGMNGLFQAARSRARGYRNEANFIAMIYLIGSPMGRLFD